MTVSVIALEGHPVRRLTQAPTPLEPSLTTTHTDARSNRRTLSSRQHTSEDFPAANFHTSLSRGSQPSSSSSPNPNANHHHDHSGNTTDAGGDPAGYVVPRHFTLSSDHPGDVLLRVRAVPRSQSEQSKMVNFYCHRDILWFASPFFRSVLEGDWKETNIAGRRSPFLRGSSIYSRSERRSEAGCYDDEDEVVDDDDQSFVSEAVSLSDEGALPGAPAKSDAHRFEFNRSGSTSSRGIPSYLPSHGAPSVRSSFHTAHNDAGDTHDSRPEVSCSPSHPHDRAAATQATLDLLQGTSLVASTSSSTHERGADPSKTPLQRLERLATPPPQAGRLVDHLFAAQGSKARSGSKSSLPRPVGGQAQYRLGSSTRKGRRPRTGGSRRSSGRRHRNRHEDASHGHGAGPGQRGLSAVIELPDEDAGTLEGALRHVYPNLDLTVTWNNCSSLIGFADKYDVCGLRKVCLDFLRVALAGRPIEALRIAEDARLDDLYKESSRHVLDNMPGWGEEELAVLSQETLLKLERKRTWFLERLLKLGLASPIRDFMCQVNCPDPDSCAKLLHERWQANYAAAFRFGPPTPSSSWRTLREFEGAGGSSAMTYRELAACQTAARTWVQLAFDRMFNLPSGLGPGRGNPKFLTIKLDQP